MSIQYEVLAGIAHVKINRPEKLNAMTLAMYRELGAAFVAARDDPLVKVILISGSGPRAFCVGADLTESIPALADGRFDISEWDDAHMKGEGFYKPVVASINGLCLGGGFEIILAADIRIAADDAEFGFPEAAMGFVPAAGTLVRLVRQIPYVFAMELMMTSNRFKADRLLRIGVLNRVVPREELDQVALAYAEQIARMGTVAIRTIKEAAQTLTHLPLTQAFTEEARLGQLTFRSDEAKEGLARFIQRKTSG
jgi:enoyl-CoA hydratase/carnithine racemase